MVGVIECVMFMKELQRMKKWRHGSELLFLVIGGGFFYANIDIIGVYPYD